MAEAFLPSDRRWDAPTLFDAAMYGAPFGGFELEWYEHDGELVASWRSVAERYVRSPKDGGWCSPERALEEYEEGHGYVGSGGLWSHQTEYEQALINADVRVIARWKARRNAPPPRPVGEKLAARSVKVHERRRGLRAGRVLKQSA
jgi:hypothetical protein